MIAAYPVPTVAAVVFDREGRVWLTREDGQYRLPGQPLAGGDDWRRSVHKLVAEAFIETGPERLVGIYSDPRYHLIGSGDARRQYLISAFRFDATVAPSDTEWFAESALPEERPPGDREIIGDAVHPGAVVTR
jgi:hypothetical protein